MATFVVSYELRARDRSYDGFIHVLRSVPHCQILESTWVIDWHGTAAEIRDRLAGHCLEDDRIFVAKMGMADGDWATQRVRNNCDRWLLRGEEVP